MKVFRCSPAANTPSFPIESKSAFDAHSGAILKMCTYADGFITTSADCKVKIWQRSRTQL